MKLPKGVKKAFEEFDGAAQSFGGRASSFLEGSVQFGAVAARAVDYEKAKAKLFEEINKMRRNDRRHGKEG